MEQQNALTQTRRSIAGRLIFVLIVIIRNVLISLAAFSNNLGLTGRHLIVLLPVGCRYASSVANLDTIGDLDTK